MNVACDEVGRVEVGVRVGGAASPGGGLIRRLSRLTAIDGAGQQAMHSLRRTHDHLCDDVLVDAGEGLGAWFILSGWVAWERRLPGDRRQIIRFLMPGDTIGLGEGPASAVGLRAVALTRVRLLDASPLRRGIADGDPAWATVGQALRVAAEGCQRQMVDQVVRLGRQNANERLCHLLLELRDRLLATGAGSEDRFPLPLTQEMLADATGLSNVHINRTLQQLRRDGLLDHRYGVVSLLHPEALEALADYRATAPRH